MKYEVGQIIEVIDDINDYYGRQFKILTIFEDTTYNIKCEPVTKLLPHEDVMFFCDNQIKLVHPAPAEDDKEYRKWVEANVIKRYEAKLANAITDLQLQEKDSTFLTEYACECKKKDVVYLTRLIADIKKGMGEGCRDSLPPSQWISVKDRLPEDGQRCWVSYPIIDLFTETVKTEVGNYLYQKPENRWGEENNTTLIAPTHWQPYFVPAPPENEQP